MRLGTRIGRWRLARLLGAVVTGIIAALLVMGVAMDLHLGAVTACLLYPTGALLAAVGCDRVLRRLYRGDVARAEQRCLEALEAALGDPVLARELLTDYASGYTARDRLPDARLKLLTAAVLNAEQSWDATRVELGELQAAQLPKDWHGCAYRLELGWALANSGAPERALELIDNALWMTRLPDAAVGPAMLARLHAAQGICLTLVDRHADAVAPLRRALAFAAAHPRVTAQRWYYLGNALAAQPKSYDEAQQAWQRARAVAPSSEWAQLAARALAAPGPSIYR